MHFIPKADWYTIYFGTRGFSAMTAYVFMFLNTHGMDTSVGNIDERYKDFTKGHYYQQKGSRRLPKN